MKHTLVLVVTSILTTGCAPQLGQFKAQQRQHAPTSNRDTGILVSGVRTEELARFLAEHPTAQYRVLSEKHALYEIFGAAKENVQGAFPGAGLERNTFFRLEGQAPMDRSQWLRKLAQGDLLKANLEKCEDLQPAPEAVLAVEVGAKDLSDREIELGARLVLDGSRSKVTTSNAGPLKMAWVILAPAGAKEREKLVLGAKLDLKPDALGAYAVALVVQDKRNACALESLEFGVTANRQYAGPLSNPESEWKDIETQKMTHLDLIHARESWTFSTGQGKSIAIIDSGVNFNHVALRNNILVNQGEIPGNSLDDDQNGFVDDVTGYDFQHNDSSAFDDDGHGSHVAGLAASGLFGMAKDAKILPVKAIGSFGGDMGSVVASIYYAVDQGVDVINMSLGTYGTQRGALMKAMDYAEAKGVVVVAAAGNGHPMTGMGLNTDEIPNYPSALPHSNLIAVAARGATGNITIYSNYGRNSVDVIAPGGGSKDDLIHSSFLENPAGILITGMAGTSMASPIVAGLAAQILAANPKLTAPEVREVMLRAGDENPDLAIIAVSSRHLDALAALKIATQSSTVKP